MDGAPNMPTAPTASTTTTAAFAEPKAKVMKEMIAMGREVQNQKRQAHRVADQERKAKGFPSP
jgi:hypothetical protein